LPQAAGSASSAAIALYPSPLLQADARKIAGALRLWELAHWLDRPGRGLIEPAELKRQALEYMSPRTFRRWLRQALDLGLMAPRSRGRFWWLEGHLRAYKRLGLRPDRRKAELPDISALFRPGWKAAIYDAFIAVVGERPISRATISRLTGKSASTQRRYQKRAGVKATRNAVLLGIPADRDWIRYMQLEEGIYFAEVDGELARPLGNSYKASRARRGARGQARKAKSLFARPEGLIFARYRDLKAASRATKRGKQNAIYPAGYHARLNLQAWSPFLGTLALAAAGLVAAEAVA